MLRAAGEGIKGRYTNGYPKISTMLRLIIPAASTLLGLITLSATTAPAGAQQQHDPTARCSDAGPLPNQIRCFLEAAESENDVTRCEGAYDFAVRFNCISLFAEHSGDPGPCERIPIRNNRLLLMRDSCVSGVAAATRDPLLCDQIQLDVVRDACFLIQVVELDAAPELCERISKTAVRKICLEPAAEPK